MCLFQIIVLWCKTKEKYWNCLTANYLFHSRLEITKNIYLLLTFFNCTIFGVLLTKQQNNETETVCENKAVFGLITSNKTI